ncbi:DUF1345 domain-containing protein [Mucilaginibacter sp. BT774]|uniref:DUF1345 domain-containing protein n=1 Tax=Mucilaginibacter sp. BT774 TaxID=3062276 RepID=UPI002674F8FC|nr:DUF1345 domain-containing protein [Mucilaginibacter sp. BT774]MDO3627899.1 DUF1345 domain-containing protein [Mucilaginibacter sp. BT774]
MPRKITANRALIFRMDAQYRLLIALVFGGIAYFLFPKAASWPAQVLTIWIVFALTIIILDWTAIFWSHPLEVRKIAKLQDSSRYVLFLFVIIASIVSLVAIVFLLKSSKGHASGVASHVLLAMAAVIVSWTLVHTIFTMRYAHLYYDTNKDDGTPRKGGGLQFPDELEPDYLDFAYFSFVIGMTFQVSDVEISSRLIRRHALVHSLISFAFNTTIVALSINVISGLVAQ